MSIAAPQQGTQRLGLMRIGRGQRLGLMRVRRREGEVDTDGNPDTDSVTE